MPRADPAPLTIDLRAPLSLANAWRFPLQTSESRRDLLIGGLWLLVPIVGWLLNMGHRVRYVHRLHHGEPAWPAWERPGELLRHGGMTFAGMLWYGWPGVSAMVLGWWWSAWPLALVGVALGLLAVIAIPGFMSHYCRAYDPREIFDPVRALGRVREGGRGYWKAWAIVIPTMLASLLGLLVFGVGFLVTSVWFWQAAAFCFANVFTQRFDLDDPGTLERRS
jgi:hypothetical protein